MLKRVASSSWNLPPIPALMHHLRHRREVLHRPKCVAGRAWRLLATAQISHRLLRDARSGKPCAPWVEQVDTLCALPARASGISPLLTPVYYTALQSELHGNRYATDNHPIGALMIEN